MKNVKCPKCGSDGPFLMPAPVTVVMTSVNTLTVEHDDPNTKDFWDGPVVVCKACGYTAPGTKFWDEVLHPYTVCGYRSFNDYAWSVQVVASNPVEAQEKAAAIVREKSDGELTVICVGVYIGHHEFVKDFHCAVVREFPPEKAKTCCACGEPLSDDDQVRTWEGDPIHGKCAIVRLPENVSLATCLKCGGGLVDGDNITYRHNEGPYHTRCL